MQPGNYFWRATIFDQSDTNTSPVNIFTITNQKGSGYLAEKSHLKTFSLDNVNYVDSLQGLILNISQNTSTS